MPLYLNRVPTVLSLSQLDKDGPDGPINAASLLTPDAAVLDVHGAYLPVYNYATAKVLKSKRVRSFGDLLSVPDIDAFVGPTLQFSDVSGSSDDDSNSSLANDVPAEAFSPRSGLRRSALDNILITEWDARSEQGLFRYDVTACESKLLPGKWGFVSQCNEGRGSKKRATEYRIDKVVQEFDRSKFNFTKALQKEVLFAFDMGDAPDDLEGHNFELKPVEESPSLVFINVSPIEHGHVLLVPRVLDFLPQQATPETVLTCLAFVKAANNPYFRAGFNSLGAYGTINHLHFQAYYLHAPFPIERAPTVPLEAEAASRKRSRDAAKVLRLADYPVNALVYEAGSCLEELATMVGSACMRLAEANIPHNLIVADQGARVFLIPQCFAERQAKGEIPEKILKTQVNPAAFEIAGHLPLKSRADYDAIDEEYAVELIAAASLPEDRFSEAVKIALCGK